MYEGRVFRPPSEAYSLIIQVTVGCAHNQCTFCSMYKEKEFRIKPLEEVLAWIDQIKSQYVNVEKVFIADGDALILPLPYWLSLLEAIHAAFPNVKRVTAYGTPSDVLNKTVEDLRLLKARGLSMIYMGLESGSAEVLRRVVKGVEPESMILAAQQLKRAGIAQSVTVISGLGGRELLRDHAIQTANVLSAMDPDYIGVLTLLLDEGTPLLADIQQGRFSLLTPEEVMTELLLLLTHLDVTHAVFRSNHASNYVSLAGNLPEDQTRLIHQIQKAMAGHTAADWQRLEDYRRL